MEARLIRIERVLENESLIALAGDIASLRNDVQGLLGEVETLGFEIDNQADGNRSLYLDLDQRLTEIEAVQVQLQSMPSTNSGSPFAGVSDQQAYDAAFALIEGQDYELAQAAFERFLGTYSASPLRDNAQYWLGETHYVQLSFPSALGEFRTVIDDYPQSDKVPDALLKIGLSNYNLNEFDQARQAFLQVMRQFPGTAAADLAEARLDQIEEEGR